MKNVLGRKQSMTVEDENKWWQVINNIEKYVSFKEVEIATVEACERINKIVAGKKAAFSWSGGKDSLVNAHLCQRVGIKNSYCIVTDCEYPSWLNYMQYNKPPECEIINAGFGLKYLFEHPEMIFPKGKTFARWYSQVQHANHRKYMKIKGIDVVVFGRRNIDGNICGKNGYSINRNNQVSFSPIYDWSHELFFAYMHYNNIEIPFIYKWKRGFYNGTHCWPERKVDTVEQGYKEIYEIDPLIIVEAAKILPSAKLVI